VFVNDIEWRDYELAYGVAESQTYRCRNVPRSQIGEIRQQVSFVENLVALARKLYCRHVLDERIGIDKPSHGLVAVPPRREQRRFPR
jgi:hypothetical protein